MKNTCKLLIAGALCLAAVATGCGGGSVAAPTITGQPASRSVVVGDSVTFSVVASGKDLAYQWYKDGASVGSATGASYTLSSVALSDAGAYRVTVTNAGGSATSDDATLAVSSGVGSGAVTID